MQARVRDTPVLNGNGGDDHICGGSGGDAISGGTGEDKVFAGKGEDDVRGDDGGDLLVAGAGQWDDVYDGNGFDEVNTRDLERDFIHERMADGNMDQDTWQRDESLDEEIDPEWDC